MTFTVELSEKQKEIVLADEGAIYVKASAGSGKTRVLTERVRHILRNTKKKVLALTFTNKAGEEIEERLSDIPDIEKRVFVGTFHAFCQSILENHGHSIGLSEIPHIFEDESDRLELVVQAIDETPSFKNKYKTSEKKFHYNVLNFISKVKRELIAEDEITLHTEDEELALLYQNYQGILRNQNAIDFDDLLLLAYNLLINYPKTAALYRRRFAAICVDEAQDLNNAQYQFLLALTGSKLSNIMMVGDANQSIYHFNGSSPDYMDKMYVKDFHPRIIELNENYRSSKSVLNAAEKIIPEAEYILGTVKEGLFELKSFQDEECEAQWVTDKINDLVSLKKHKDIEGDINYEKIAILARNKYVFKEIEMKFIEYELPFYYKMTPGGVRFESEVMNVFDLGFRVMLNPQDTLHKHRLLKNLKISVDKELDLKSMIPLISDDAKTEVIQLVLNLRDDGSNLISLFNRFSENLKVDDQNERQMILNDVSELNKHWHNYARKTDNKSLHQFKNAMALGQTHPLSQHSGITLSTVHTMKGQEFDIVFVIGMDDETFPDYRAVKKQGIDLTQEKNNLYVAFTRARRFLFVSWPQKRFMPWGDSKSRRISRFLKSF